MDRTALETAREERIDWRFKGLPSSLQGMTIRAAADARPDLFTDGFLGPYLALDDAALEHNLTTMAEWAAANGLVLAPHGKTTMCPELFARQIDHGAWGVTAANASQLRVYRAFGVSRVLLANQLVDPAGLRWLAAELDADPSFEFSCWVDSVQGVRLMTRVLGECGADRPVDVLVELGGDGGRTGARDAGTAVAVARAAHASPFLRLAGTGGYEGALAHDRSEGARQVVTGYLRSLRELTISLAAQGLFDEIDRVLVTAGGSAYFDQIAAELTSGWPDGLPVVPVLRSGAYLTHDDGFYQDISPLGANPRIEGVPALRPALRVWAQVTSRPTAELALLTMGKRDASFDEGLPKPRWHRRPGSPPTALAEHTITALNDQHAFLALPAGSPVEVGDWVGVGLSHPCTVFDKWPLIPVVDGDGSTVIDFVRTYF